MRRITRQTTFTLIAKPLLWAMTGIGFLHARICGIKKIQRIDKVFYIEVRRVVIWPFPFQFTGFTWGYAIIYASGHERVIAHELVHVEQEERFWGFFFFLYYLECFLRMGEYWKMHFLVQQWRMFFNIKKCVQYSYRANRFEVEAYARAANMPNPLIEQLK